jgi:NAD(P)-dependent dehydrogenase (short-subunit alcohol dehydrogenase family)
LFNLAGRTALVTGAGQNIGAGIARALAAQGALVIVNDIDAGKAAAIAEEITSAGGQGVASAFDVTDLEAVTAAVSKLPPVNILVNNAGNGGAQPMSLRPFRDMDPAAWDGPIRVNLYGVLNCTRAVINGMCDAGWGRLVTISSGAGTGGASLGVAPYSAGKGGGISFMRTLALEVARHGVTANTLALGLMGTPQIATQLVEHIPVGRTGTPDDVAAACVWLVSDEASWVTGQTIELNGGQLTT